MSPHCSQRARKDPRFAFYIGITGKTAPKVEWARWAVRQRNPIVSKIGGASFTADECIGTLGFSGLVLNEDKYMLYSNPRLDTNPNPNHSRNRNHNPPGSC